MFLNNRYYDPTTGVFLSVDPLVSVTGDPYLYAHANPTTLSDPTGLDPGCRAGMPYSGCSPKIYQWRSTAGSASSEVTADSYQVLATRQELQPVQNRITGPERVGPRHGDVRSDGYVYTCGPDGAASSSGCDWMSHSTPVSGACGDIGLSAGVAAGAAICVVMDSNEIAVVAVAGLGGGAGSDMDIGGAASVTAGPLVSNARDIDEILGFSVCGGGGGGEGIAVTGEFCFGLTGASGQRTGIWTTYVGAGVGAGADFHVYETHTWELFSIPTDPFCWMTEC